jgi:hypothetical protein
MYNYYKGDGVRDQSQAIPHLDRKGIGRVMMDGATLLFLLFSNLRSRLVRAAVTPLMKWRRLVRILSRVWCLLAGGQNDNKQRQERPGLPPVTSMRTG